MTELLPRLIPLLLVDVINPVLFALVLSALGSERPIGNSLSLVVGHTFAYFLVGIGAALGLEQITDRLMNPHSIDYLVSAAVGVLCLWAALKSRGGGASEQRGPETGLTPLRAFSTGAIVNFIGAPFAVPYLAAIDQILRIDLSAQAAILVLLGYNLVYALPFVLVALLGGLTGERLMPSLQKINGALAATADTLMPFILLLLGLALTADALLFWWSGRGLL